MTKEGSRRARSTRCRPCGKRVSPAGARSAGRWRDRRRSWPCRRMRRRWRRAPRGRPRRCRRRSRIRAQSKQERAADRHLRHRAASPHRDALSRLDVAVLRGHEPGREDVGEEQHLLVGQPVRDLHRPDVRERHARTLRLARRHIPRSCASSRRDRTSLFHVHASRTAERLPSILPVTRRIDTCRRIRGTEPGRAAVDQGARRGPTPIAPRVRHWIPKSCLCAPWPEHPQDLYRRCSRAGAICGRARQIPLTTRVTTVTLTMDNR
jgi:hypothetical protein